MATAAKETVEVIFPSQGSYYIQRLFIILHAVYLYVKMAYFSCYAASIMLIIVLLQIDVLWTILILKKVTLKHLNIISLSIHKCHIC